MLNKDQILQLTKDDQQMLLPDKKIKSLFVDLKISLLSVLDKDKRPHKFVDVVIDMMFVEDNFLFEPSVI